MNVHKKLYINVHNENDACQTNWWMYTNISMNIKTMNAHKQNGECTLYRNKMVNVHKQNGDCTQTKWWINTNKEGEEYRHALHCTAHFTEWVFFLWRGTFII